MTPPARARVFLGLGANLGTPLAQLREAVRALAGRYGDLRVGGVYASPPEDGSEQPEYRNTVVGFETRDGPEAVLDFGLSLEDAAGRVRRRRGGARTLDVDLLFHGAQVCATSRLTLPHPRWASRPFVVLPLVDLSPEWVDPATGRTVAEVAAAAGWGPGSLPRVLPPGALLEAGEAAGSGGSW